MWQLHNLVHRQTPSEDITKKDRLSGNTTDPAPEWLPRCLLRVLLCSQLYKLSPLHPKHSASEMSPCISSVSLTCKLT